MNRGLYLTVGFALSALVGSGISWCVLKNRYEEEINECLQEKRKEAAEERREEKKAEKSVRDKIDARALNNKPSIIEYAEKLKNEGYTTKYTNTERPVVKDTEPDDEPDVIPPETFMEGHEKGYEQIGLTYYADGVLADDGDEILEDADSIVGDFAEHYGDYEDDVVYVRNEARETDYEICKDNRTYEEVSGKKPHRVEI